MQSCEGAKNDKNAFHMKMSLEKQGSLISILQNDTGGSLLTYETT